MKIRSCLTIAMVMALAASVPAYAQDTKEAPDDDVGVAKTLVVDDGGGTTNLMMMSTCLAAGMEYFKYDSQGRLIEVNSFTGIANMKIVYEYDPSGDRTKKAVTLMPCVESLP